MTSLPESVLIGYNTHKDEQQVWVQEFNSGFIEGFNWQIADHT